MNRALLTVRGGILLLFAVYAFWMLPAGVLFAEQFGRLMQEGSNARTFALLIAWATLIGYLFGAQALTIGF